jgi:hypothetical protein
MAEGAKQMDHREKVEIIAGILSASEEDLSDGYGYYCGADNVDKTLAGIAEAILTGVEPNPAAPEVRDPAEDLQRINDLLTDATVLISDSGGDLALVAIGKALVGLCDRLDRVTFAGGVRTAPQAWDDCAL